MVALLLLLSGRGRSLVKMEYTIYCIGVLSVLSE